MDGLGFSLLLHSIKALRVDVVCVLGHDKLYADMMGRWEDGWVGGWVSCVCKEKRNLYQTTHPPTHP